MMTSKPPLKKWLGNLSLIGISVIIALLVAEYVVRAAKPQNLVTPITSYVFRNDAEVDYLFKPHLDRIFRQGDFEVRVISNSIGISDAEILPRKGPNELRILVLGDSFTWGGYTGDITHGYPRFLERTLRQHQSLSATTVRVVNAAIPGYGTRQELKMYLKLRKAVQPDIVILGFFMGNDFYDNAGLTRHTVVNDYLINRQSLGPTTGLRVLLFQHSHLYRLLELWNPVSTRSAPYYHGMRLTFFDDAEHDFDNASRLTQKYLDALLATTVRDKVHLLVVLIPDRLQLDPQLAESSAERLGLDFSHWSPERPHLAVLAWLAENRVPFMDLVPVFFDSHSELGYDRIYAGYNQHTSRVGNELIAAALARSVLDLDLEVARGFRERKRQ